MNRGPLIFLGAFFALACSWAALVLAPQLQLGALQPGNIVNSSELYPAPRPGTAQQGAEVYRANGCFHCHTEQVRQSGITFGAVLTDPGTNTAEVINTLLKVKPDLKDAAAAKLALAKLPVLLTNNTSPEWANIVMKPFADTGAKTELTFTNLGADISAGLGVRGSVARDYVFDSSVMLGGVRIGPDLANVGIRAPEKFVGAWNFSAVAKTNDLAQAAERAQWHLVHLYNPRLKAKDSTMPGYSFLFEKRPAKSGAPSADALPLGKDVTGEGFEIVPKPEAHMLVAYLLSLRQNASLPERAIPQPPKLPAPATNAPAASAPKP